MRIALRDPRPLARLLERTNAELLLWTGAGEPPVSERVVEAAKRAFPEDRVAFDANVAASPATAAAHALRLGLYRAWRRFGAAAAALAPARAPRGDDDDDHGAPGRAAERTCCRRGGAFL